MRSIYLAIIIVLIIVLICMLALLLTADLYIHQFITSPLSQLRKGPILFERRKKIRDYSPKNILQCKTFNEKRREVDDIILKAQDFKDNLPNNPNQLAMACNLALEGGKRLRSIILSEVARAVSIQRRDIKPVDPCEAVLFIEYIHTASLIIDDSPAFDNDSIRRNKPAIHTIVGTGKAQMAAIALFAAGIQNICRQLCNDAAPWGSNQNALWGSNQNALWGSNQNALWGSNQNALWGSNQNALWGSNQNALWGSKQNNNASQNSDIGMKICNIITDALGQFGAAGGQFKDITSLTELSANSIDDIIYEKTATFFEIAVSIGWLIAGGDDKYVTSMLEIGKYIGIAFQLADDISDMKKDSLKSAWNYANIYGKEIAEREMNKYLADAKLFLTVFRLWTPLWEEIYEQIYNMSKSF